AFRGELLELVPEAEVDASAPLSALLASIDFINGNTRSGSRRLVRARKAWPQAADPALQAVLLFAELLHSTNKGKFSNTARCARARRERAPCRRCERTSVGRRHPGVVVPGGPRHRRRPCPRTAIGSVGAERRRVRAPAAHRGGAQGKADGGHVRPRRSGGARR